MLIEISTFFIPIYLEMEIFAIYLSLKEKYDSNFANILNFINFNYF